MDAKMSVDDDLFDFWVILDGDRCAVTSSDRFRPSRTIFSERDSFFYGTVTKDEIVVGFNVHATHDDLGLEQPLPFAKFSSGSVFPSFLLVDTASPNEIVEQYEEMFGDLCLFQDDRLQFAFLFHQIDVDHPLYSLLSRCDDEKLNGAKTR